MTDGAAPVGRGTSGQPEEAPGLPGEEAAPSGRARLRLSLSDPVTGSASEDRPESWGDRVESDADRRAHYEAQRPPHHGG